MSLTDSPLSIISTAALYCLSGSSIITKFLQCPSVNLPSCASSITLGSKFKILTEFAILLLLSPIESASSFCVMP